MWSNVSLRSLLADGWGGKAAEGGARFNVASRSDDSGLWYRPPVAIGHRRLAIIDIGHSKQPMQDPSGRYILSYNGEIYNFKELRQGLKDTWTFRTSGDTEVVLAGLAVHGDAFLARMEGMWALAFWDNHEKSLLLTRDRMGKKPLFYHKLQHGIAAASELPVLSRVSNTGWREDPDSTADYLRYGYYLPGTTAYTNVREVLPGHVLRWTPANTFSEKSYWSLAINDFQGSKDDASEKLRVTLIRAVEKRLVADVEVGAFLSGGVDSSLIVAILNQELGIRPKTFTIGFDESSYDERTHARFVARENSTDHFEEKHTWDPDLLKKIILQHVGQPFIDSSILPTAAVSRLASRHVKVALSGDGGDELFSGYQRYQARTLLRWYTRLPVWLRKNVERVIKAIPEPMAHHSHSLLKKAHLFCNIVERQNDEHPYVAPLFYSKSDLLQLAPDLANKGHRPPHIPEQTRLDSIHEMMAADALIYLPQDILTKVDRASMAFSIEARTPFLDREVVELAFSLPRYWHRSGLAGKKMLRRTFGHILPGRIWRRRKQGFGVPIHRWFRAELGLELDRLVADTDTYLEKSVIRRLLNQHRTGQCDHGHRLWGIYIYLLWNQKILNP